MRPALFIFLTLLLFSCEKFDPHDDIKAENDIKLDYLFKTVITQNNGLIIAGVFDSKLTIIKTDANFKALWRRDDFDWGTQIYGSGWGSTFYATEVINIFEDDLGNYLLIVSVTQGGCVVESSVIVSELNNKGKEVRKKEIKDFGCYNAIRSADGGCLLWGTKVLKLDKGLYGEWEKNYYSTDGLWVGKMINTSDGRYALTSWNGDISFFKILDSGGNEAKSEEYSFTQYRFNETGNDLIQADDNEFIIAGRTRKITEPFDIDCGITRVDLSGTKKWTTIFGSGSDEWLEDIIYSADNEMIIQGKQGFPNDPVRKTILVKMDFDGHITDSCRVDRIEKLLYHPHEYFVETHVVSGQNVHFRKIPFNELFD